MKSILWAIALSLGMSPGPCFGGAEPAGGMVIHSGTPWVVAADQPEAVQRALKDVGRDWYKVFGRRLQRLQPRELEIAADRDEEGREVISYQLSVRPPTM